MIKKIFIYIRRNRLRLLIGVLIVLTIIGVSLRLLTPQAKPVAVALPQTPFKNNILIGNVFRTDLIKQLGTPASTVIWREHPDLQIDNYPVSGSKWSTQIYSDKNSGKVNLVIEQSSPLTPTPISQVYPQFPEPPTLVFGDLSNSGYYLQLYPNRGVGYLARFQNGDILQTYYFQPTSDRETFVSDIGTKFGFTTRPMEESLTPF